MLRKTTTNHLAPQIRKRLTNKLSQLRTSKRSFSTPVTNEVKQDVNKEVVTNTTSKPEGVDNITKAADNLASKPNPVESNTKPPTATATSTTATPESTSIASKVDATAPQSTTQQSTQQQLTEQKLSEQHLNDLPPFIRQQLQFAQNNKNPNTKSSFYFEEFHTGPDGKGTSSSYRGSYTPEHGFKMRHASTQHDPSQPQPTVTTKLFYTEPPTQPQLTHQATSTATNNGEKITTGTIANNNINSVLEKQQQQPIQNKLMREHEFDHPFSEFEHPFFDHPFFNRHRPQQRLIKQKQQKQERPEETDGEVDVLDVFFDDFFHPMGSRRTQLVPKRDKIAQLQKHAENDQIEFQPTRSRTRAYEDPFELIEDIFGAPFGRQLRRRQQQYQQEHHNDSNMKPERLTRTEKKQQYKEQKAQEQAQQHQQQAQQQPVQQAVQQQQQPVQQQQSQHFAQQQSIQPPIQQQQQNVAQQQVASQAPIQQVQPQQQVQPHQHQSLYAQQHPIPPQYYDPQYGFTPEGFNQFAHNLHKNMEHFNNSIRQLERFAESFQRPQRQSYTRRQHPRDDFFDGFDMDPFHMHHGFGSFGGFPFGSRRGGFYGI